jgi:hypothetical protein
MKSLAKLGLLAKSATIFVVRYLMFLCFVPIHSANRRGLAMKNLYKIVLGSIFVLLFSCSSDEQQVEEQVNADGQQASEEINNSDTVGDEGMANESEVINNAGDDEFADEGMNNELNLGNNNQMGSQQSLSNVPVNEVPAANPVPSNVVPVVEAPPEETVVPMETPAVAPASGNGVVKYVRSPTSIVDQPGGASVGTLEQGDHPLVWDDGQFAKLPNGKMVPSSSLSDQGIGRVRAGHDWR